MGKGPPSWQIQKKIWWGFTTGSVSVGCVFSVQEMEKYLIFPELVGIWMFS